MCVRRSDAWDEITDMLVKARTLGTLGRQSTSNPAPLNVAIRMLGEALQLASPDYPLYDVLLEEASFLLLGRYDGGDREDDLAQALLLCRKAVSHTPDDAPELMARRLITLGNALRRKRRLTARPASDEEAEVFACAAVSAGPTSPYTGHAVDCLRRSLKEAEPSQDSATLAVALLRRVRAAHPNSCEFNGDLAHWLHVAAEWLMRGYEQGLHSWVTGLREAAGMLGEAAQLVGHDAFLGSDYLAEQSVVLQTVHRQTREMSVLDAAIGACRKAADATHVRPLHRAGATARLGEQLLNRYLITGNSGDLHESADRWDEALASPDLPDKTRCWGALASLEAHDYQARQLVAPVTRQSTLVPLELVMISSCDDETSLTPYASAAGRPGAHRQGPVARLVSAAAEELRRCALHTDTAAAQSAVDAAREAVLATPAGDPGLPPLLLMYADACRLQITLSGEFSELDFVAGLYRWAARTLPEDDPHVSDTWAKTANMVIAYTMLAGFADPQDGTIGALRCAVDRASASDPERRVLLWRLADGLHDRYEETGDLADLDESIEFSNQASYALTGNEQALCLRNLADRLRHRFGLTNDTNDWMDATFAARGAAAADPEIELTVDEMMGINRHLMKGKVIEEPDSTMRRCREALHRARPGDSQALADLARLRRILMGRMAHRGAEGGPPDSRAELDEAVAVHRRLDELTPPDSLRERTVNGHGLALTLHHRYKLFGDPRDKDEAISTAQRTAALGGLPQLTIRAAQAAATWAADDEQWQRAAECFREAVSLLPVLSPRQASRESQERRLKTMFGLASNGAAAALQCGDANAALEVLEQGRGLLRGYATEGCRDFPELTAAGPEGEELARGLRSVADKLAAAATEDSTQGGGSAGEAGSDRRHGLARRWDDLVHAARELPGLKDFQRPVRAADLLPGTGATVVLNASQYRCDALLIQSGKLEVVPLPDLSIDALNKQMGRFVDVMAFTHLNPYDEEAQRFGQRPLREVLAWLWEVVCGPRPRSARYDPRPRL